jgi:hypothetical protein
MQESPMRGVWPTRESLAYAKESCLYERVSPTSGSLACVGDLPAPLLTERPAGLDWRIRYRESGAQNPAVMLDRVLNSDSKEPTYCVD